MRCLPGRKQCRRSKQDGPCFLQGNLLHVVLEFDCGLDPRQCTVTGIQHVAGKVGDFLVDKTFRAAHLKISKLQFRSVSLFRRTERKTRLRRRRRWSRDSANICGRAPDAMPKPTPLALAAMAELRYHSRDMRIRPDGACGRKNSEPCSNQAGLRVLVRA